MNSSNYHNISFAIFVKRTAKDSPHSKVTLRVEEDDEDGIVSVYAFDQFEDYLTSFSYIDRFEVEEDVDMAIKEYQLDIEITK